ncbi:MAG: hypothetical protein E7316_04635 [Clostridiales bacterium]|nr:hypothetical protein [Clostridiales bacterium]
MEHELKPCGVYIRADETNRITAINSGAFLPDTEGWTLIDQGYGDRYAHAQGNYLPMPLVDDRGVCRFKLVEGVVTERTAAEMDADFAALPPPEQTNEELLLEIAANHEYRLCMMELGLNESEVM